MPAGVDDYSAQSRITLVDAGGFTIYGGLPAGAIGLSCNDHAAASQIGFDGEAIRIALEEPHPVGLATGFELGGGGAEEGLAARIEIGADERGGHSLGADNLTCLMHRPDSWPKA